MYTYLLLSSAANALSMILVIVTLLAFAVSLHFLSKASDRRIEINFLFSFFVIWSLSFLCFNYSLVYIQSQHINEQIFLSFIKRKNACLRRFSLLMTDYSSCSCSFVEQSALDLFRRFIFYLDHRERFFAFVNFDSLFAVVSDRERLDLPAFDLHPS